MHYTMCGAVCFSLPISIVMIERIHILCLIIIIKSEVWTITQCLGFGHETMVCTVCLSIFLSLLSLLLSLSFGKQTYVSGRNVLGKCCVESRNSLTHWGRVTHICVGKLIIIGSDNGLSLERRQAIIWINAGILLIGPLGTNFSEILIEIQTFSLKKMRLKMSSAKCCSFRPGLNVLNSTIMSNKAGLKPELNVLFSSLLAVTIFSRRIHTPSAHVLLSPFWSPEGGNVNLMTCYQIDC